MARPPDDITGQRFGKLIAIKNLGVLRPKYRICTWECICDCGNKHIATITNLKRGNVSSCGCRMLKTKEGCHKSELFNSYKRNAIRRNHEFKLTFEDFIALVQKPCFYCGGLPKLYHRQAKIAQPFYNNGLDRIDNELGYLMTNVVPCCEKCNRAKLAMAKDEFLQWIDSVYQHSIAKNATIKANGSIG